MIFEVNNIDQYGVIPDRPPFELPFNAWSGASNIRFRNGFAEAITGHQSVMGTPSVAPYALLNVLANPSGLYWLYAGLNKVYVYDGAVHTNITRQTAGIDVNYAATADLNWTMGVFADNPFLNNGIDPPQVWTPETTGTKLQILPNWPAPTTICGSLRAFRNYLVALNVTQGGFNYPHMVKWSSGSNNNALPVTWDPTDPTHDAGEYNIVQNTDDCVDGVPLRDVFCIYKQDSIWAMQYVGGGPIFAFEQLFDNTGILSKRCAVEFQYGKHAVFTTTDIIVHDGQYMESLVNEKIRNAIFNNLDPTTGGRSFVAHNWPLFEVWFCWVTIGGTLPNKALIWNYKKNTFSFRDLPNAADIEPGIIASMSDAWNQAVGTWITDSAAWGAPSYNPNSRQMAMAVPVGPSLYQIDSSNQFAGVNITSTLERSGLGFPFRKGEPPDFTSRKRLTNLFPRIQGTVGEVVNVYVATQDETGLSPTWKGPYPYTIGTTRGLAQSANATTGPFLFDSRLFGFRFSYSGSGTWSISGYEVEMMKSGRY
jgi:hypothetical protein